MTENIQEKARKTFAQLQNYPTHNYGKYYSTVGQDILRYERPKDQLAVT